MNCATQQTASNQAQAPSGAVALSRRRPPRPVPSLSPRLLTRLSLLSDRGTAW